MRRPSAHTVSALAHPAALTIALMTGHDSIDEPHLPPPPARGSLGNLFNDINLLAEIKHICTRKIVATRLCVIFTDHKPQGGQARSGGTGETTETAAASAARPHCNAPAEDQWLPGALDRRNASYYPRLLATAPTKAKQLSDLFCSFPFGGSLLSST
jgi:hypothetical protein